MMIFSSFDQCQQNDAPCQLEKIVLGVQKKRSIWKRLSRGEKPQLPQLVVGHEKGVFYMKYQMI